MHLIRVLTVADEYDIQVALHSDTLNEAGFVENTIEAIDGRVIHIFHTEGAGGGHAPDQLKLAAIQISCQHQRIRQNHLRQIQLMNIWTCLWYVTI